MIENVQAAARTLGRHRAARRAGPGQGPPRSAGAPDPEPSASAAATRAVFADIRQQTLEATLAQRETAEAIRALRARIAPPPRHAAGRPGPTQEEADPELRRWIETEERAARANPQRVLAIRRVSGAFGVLCVVIGVIVLVGWHANLPQLTTVRPGLTSMKWWTAVSVILLGAGITATAVKQSPSTRIVAVCLGSVVAVLGLIFVLEYLVDSSFGLDNPFGLDPGPSDGHPGRMALGSASSLLLLASALVLHKRGRMRTAQSLAVVATATGFLAMVGYVFDVSTFYSLDRSAGMSLLAGVVVLLAGPAILGLRADRGYMGTISGNTAGGRVARRMLPVVIVLPPLLGWLALTTMRNGMLDPAFALALVTTALSLFNAVSVWNEANGLRAVDLKRAGTEAALRRLREAEAQQRMLTAELAASHRRTSAILESAVDAFIGLDGDGVITAWNAAAKKLYGWDAGEAIGTRVDELLAIHTADGARVDVRIDGRWLDHAIERGPGMYKVVRKDGTFAEVEGRVWAQDEQFERRFTVLVRDVAERNRVERELRELNRDLDEFAAVAAHDLRGPLTVVRGYLELIEDAATERGDTRELGLVNRAMGATDRGVQLIDDLLAYSRAGRTAIARTRVDLTELARDVAAEMPVRTERECIVEVRELAPVSGDAAVLRQVLTNLVYNAVRYCPPDRLARVVVGLTDSTDESQVWVTVSDNGDGVPLEERDGIFEMFTRGSTGAQRSGTGVGLALCRRVVERHSGTITLDDAPAADGGGARFTISLPRHLDT